MVYFCLHHLSLVSHSPRKGKDGSVIIRKKVKPGQNRRFRCPGSPADQHLLWLVLVLPLIGLCFSFFKWRLLNLWLLISLLLETSINLGFPKTGKLGFQFFLKNLIPLHRALCILLPYVVRAPFWVWLNKPCVWSWPPDKSPEVTLAMVMQLCPHLRSPCPCATELPTQRSQGRKQVLCLVTPAPPPPSPQTRCLLQWTVWLLRLYEVMVMSFGDVTYVSLLLQWQLNGVQSKPLWFLGLSLLLIWVNNGKFKHWQFEFREFGH